MSRLTAKQVADIRRRHAAGESMASIARRYGMAKSGIQHQIEAERKGIKQRPKAAPERKAPSFRVVKCPVCPMLFHQTKQQQHCSEACYRRSLRIAEREFLAEVEWVAGTDTWDNIARRFGMANRKSLARRLHRNGAIEMAKEVERVGLPFVQWAA